MINWTRQWPRILVTFLPVLLALMHVLGVVRVGMLDRIDDLIYDARLRATMPRTLDERIVIVDVDEKSLAEVGRWPWSRNRLAELTTALVDHHGASVVGFDVVFAEPDVSSGWHQLQKLATGELSNVAGFSDELARLRTTLDYDGLFASALAGRRTVLGYYFTSDREGRTSGALPPPAMDAGLLKGRPISFTQWNGFGANLPVLNKAAASAGYFNSISDEDGVIRSVPLLAEYGGKYYESLALAMFRQLMGGADIEPGFPRERFVPMGYQGLESVVLRQGDKSLAIPVDQRVATLVPFRGPGGPAGGSFRYVSAADVLAGRTDLGVLKDRIVLVGTTAPGLLDLRVTPVGQTYPGVEAHANVISGFLDGKVFVKPDYALGYEMVMVLFSGILLALALPQLTAVRAVMLSLVVVCGVAGLNFWLYLGHGLALPLATALFMIATAFALNMSYGYFVESRSKRELAQLFGTYVPPELVDEMVKDPDSYTMQAEARELTVMFCDMRGFTQLSESMDPGQLQALLNRVFSRLTQVIRGQRGTIDKYMGDCVMAFWGAPVPSTEHASKAVEAALGMAHAVRQLNEEHQAQGLPAIGVGIGLNTGPMFVGDMGSDIRRSYTVIGDAVNLGSRLEALSRVYGVDIVVGESTRRQAPGFVWQELDRVRVKGKEEAVTIFTPRGVADAAGHGRTAPSLTQELALWARLLKAYRAQDWDACDLHLLNLERMCPDQVLYRLYAQRIATQRALPFDAAWDGGTRFESK